MSAESSLTAVAVVRALLNEDIEGLAVLLPDGLPEPGRELVASLTGFSRPRSPPGPRAPQRASTSTGSSRSGWRDTLRPPGDPAARRAASWPGGLRL